MSNRRRRRAGGDYRDEKIESDDEDNFEILVEENEEENETIDAKRIRLAREYLERVEIDEEESSCEDDSSSDDRIGRKLAKERLMQEGGWNMDLADKIDVSSAKLSYLSRKHDLSPTCISLEKSGRWAYSGSKDHSVVMWDVETQCFNGIVIPNWKKTDKNIHFPRNNGEVLAVAASDDGRYLATGGRDTLIKIFDVRQVGKNASNKSLVKVFEGAQSHKRAVTSLAFRNNSLQFFSGGEDGCIRHYNLDLLSYIETLYGHQSSITGISCDLNNVPISTSRDRTIRSWKLDQETHLIYRGGSSCSIANCVSIINKSYFLTGHDNGSLNLWGNNKKKPIASAFESTEVVSCNILRGSDIALTGSCDGFLRLFKIKTSKDMEECGIDLLGSIPVKGYINAIEIGPNANFALVAVGQEHRLGRWDRVPMAKNRIGVISLNQINDNADASCDD